MSKPITEKEGFVFTAVEENGDEVIIEVSEEDYEREKAQGVEEEFLLKPGRHKFIRGGFRKRHPDFKPSDLEPRNIRVTFTLPLALDVFKYFERRAAELNLDSCQTLINDTLRAVMEREMANQAPAKLLENEDFIKAVAERVKVLTTASRKRRRAAKTKTATKSKAMAKPKAKAA